MRLISFKHAKGTGLAVRQPDGSYRGLTRDDSQFPGGLREILRAGGAALKGAADALSTGQEIDPDEMEFLPPLMDAGKVICIGLNYVDHSVESGFEPPEYPAVFVRFNSSLIGHLAPIVRPRLSEQLDYEGELVAIVGKVGRHIPKASALEHIA